MTEDKKRELKNALLNAQEKMFEAIELLEYYVDKSGDRNAQAYLVDHLKIMTSNGHGFLSSALNMDDLIKRIEEEETNE